MRLIKGISNSIRKKIVVIVMMTTIFTIVFSVILCRFFLEDFYINKAKSELANTYETIADYFSDDENVRDFRAIADSEGDGQASEYMDFFEKIPNPSASTIYIIDSNDFMIYSTNKLTLQAQRGVQYIIQQAGDLSQLDHGYKIFDHTFDSTREFFKSSNGIKSGHYFDLIGTCDNGFIVVLRSPYELINDDISYASGLFSTIFLGLTLIEIIMIVLVTNRFSRPVIQMSKAAGHIANLDFEVEIPEVKSHDEIGYLARSMKDMSEKLEKSVSDLKSANLQLSQDIKKKEQIEEMRSEFLSHVSHELKTPIALIQGYSEGLKEGVSDDPESMNYYLDVIIDEASKMNALVMRLINLNEIESSAQALNIERFNVVQLIQDVINNSKVLVDQKEANINFNTEDDCFVWADEFMIEEVITNYLTNAIHYVTEKGQIRIWLEDKNNTVRVNVYNQGNQIEDKDIEKLFIKFYKADAARTREYGGSGIGLSIVSAIMKAHDKDYGVYNVDDGVVFYFELDTKKNIE